MTASKFTPLKPKSENQKKYVEAIRNSTITFCKGYAGTGKTIIALSVALELFYDKKHKYDRIIIVRPYIKSKIGETIGALPGELTEKIGPFSESVMDNLRQLCSKDELSKLTHGKDIEFSILSMCRGRSFNNCIVIVEEAQNVPKIGDAMKMLLTRIGHNCKLIICGDTDQCDINPLDSALQSTIEFLADISGISIVELNSFEDIQRNPIVRKILKRYEETKRYGEAYGTRV